MWSHRKREKLVGCDASLAAERADEALCLAVDGPVLPFLADSASGWVAAAAFLEEVHGLDENS